MQQQWLVIGISGVTCGGKSSLAQSLYDYFSKRAGQELKAGIQLNRTELINQDAYFRDVNDPNHQKIEKLNHMNWEILESINMDKMISDIMAILGQKFKLYNTRSSSLVNGTQHENLFEQNFNSTYHQSYNDTDEMMRSVDEECNFNKIVKHNTLLNILIIDGFLIFNHPVTFDLCNVKYHLHVPYEVCQARRSRRVYDPPDVQCYFEMVVWPHYEKNLREFKDRKEVMFLNGEAAPEKCFDFVLKSLVNEL